MRGAPKRCRQQKSAAPKTDEQGIQESVPCHRSLVAEYISSGTPEACCFHNETNQKPVSRQMLSISVERKQHPCDCSFHPTVVSSAGLAVERVFLLRKPSQTEHKAEG